MEYADEVFSRMEKVYGGEGPQLKFNSEFELLVAVILSAQCTDVRVNKVTKELFAVRNRPEDFAYMDIDILADAIHSCGCYMTKARSIIEASRAITEQFGGKVPQTMEELMSLRGVGRKTANVVMANAFGGDNFAVDTHVFRTTRRIGLTRGKTPEAVESDMLKLLPEGKRGAAHHWFIWHGRRVCHSRKPDCDGCFLSDICKKCMDKPADNKNTADKA